MPTKKVLIMGAAGRDFHNFNVVFRNAPDSRVVAFTATQIPNIDGRRYPAELAGPAYPEGIPIHPEKDLETLIRDLKVDEVVFSYSDVPYTHVMSVASRVVACGADFKLLSAPGTMLPSKVPIVSVCAIRTGSGKSQTTRKVCSVLHNAGLRVVAIRHPMPYGNLVAQRVQRFAELADLDRQECTIEEREEYEPHIVAGTVIYAGVDYADILAQAETEADVIVWDGGNNDTPFYRADIEIVVLDPHRPGHELSYYPSEVNLRRANVLLINKVSTAPADGLRTVRESARRINPGAVVIEADSPITAEDPSAFRGKKVLAIEDGPTLTHGEMKYGAATIAAKEGGAAELVDPRPWAVGTIAKAFKDYPGIGPLLPAIGYGGQQVADLQETIRRVPCDVLAIGTPVDLRRIVSFDKPAVRVTYELAERGKPDLAEVLARFTGGSRRAPR